MAHSSVTTSYLESIAAVNACTWTGCQTSSANLSFTPTFVDPAANFHIASGKALVDVGTSTTPWITGGLGHLDVDRDRRPK